ncbi:MAG: 50S ribosomal protein L7/L12 [Candidatus Pacebacteria bacterium]|nr:50S ribosomal protein L7/L12 [Candidatus Paceibacterota bacterium]
MSEEKKDEVKTEESTLPANESKEEKVAEEKTVQPLEDSSESENIETPVKFKTIVDAIEKMSVIDLNELVKFLEKKFGVSAQAAVAPVQGESASSEEEKSVFTVHLVDFGAQKIAVIKVVKEVLGLGLKEAKDLVDAAPSNLKEGVKKEEAEEIKKKIEEAGGKAELK